MAFVESQQDPKWKRDPNFDRRDVAVITQNALCDSYYTHYIRNQYDDRYRPKPADYTPFEKWLGRDKAYPVPSVTCLTDEELFDSWEEFRHQPDTMARVKAGGPVLRPGSNDPFDIDAIVARRMFEANKKEHTFYIEQSVPLTWMYPYLLPWGLILKLNPTPMDSLPQAEIDKDYKFWDAYSKKLLENPRFRLDDDAVLNFGKLALWHADLYRYRHLPKEEEHWLRLSLAFCPQLPDATIDLTHLLVEQKRFDEAITVAQTSADADPINEKFPAMVAALKVAKTFGAQEEEIRANLAKAPYDVHLNLDLAALLQNEEKYDEVNERLRTAAGLTNWTHDDMTEVIQYYVDKVHNPYAAIAFLEARAKIDPKASQMIYYLAGLHASLDHRDEAIKYLTQASQYGGTNALISATIDPKFQSLHDDPRFQALMASISPTNSSAVVPAPDVPKAKK
jgi:hypothetical protein